MVRLVACDSSPFANSTGFQDRRTGESWCVGTSVRDSRAVLTILALGHCVERKTDAEPDHAVNVVGRQVAGSEVCECCRYKSS